MKNCLVTKLKAVVDNDSLVKLNELKLFYLEDGKYINLGFGAPTTIICSKDMTVDGVNVGKSYTMQPGTANQKNVYAPAGAVVSIPNKYDITSLSMEVGTSVSFGQLGYNLSLFCVPSGTGTTDEFKHFQGTFLTLKNASVSGDIASFREPAINYCDSGCSVLVPGTYGNIESFVGITKDIPYPTHTKFTDVYTGDLIKVLATARNTMITGNWFYLTGLSGDISTAKKEFYYIGCSSVFSWKNTRPSSYPIIMMNSLSLGNDVDAMLINQAECTLADDSKYTDHGTVLKTIAVKGTHTPGPSVNAAIKTLISKGITVKVNDITLTGNET